MDFAVKNIANTNVTYWGDRLLALYERGLPHRLANDLTTMGEDDLDGSVDGAKFFAAHYRWVQRAVERRIMRDKPPIVTVVDELRLAET